MAIKFQYNKTSLGELGKQLKMRQKALPTIKSKESALRLEVKKAKGTAADFERRLAAAIDTAGFMPGPDLDQVRQVSWDALCEKMITLWK